ncbi:hypothetical protein ACEPLH_005060 [Klebsiella quasipneumoniae]|nr:hypothetical protein [Klebsiella quasipneumoniae subsp. similipneumoniae]HDG8150834.1 hypothetical protein [Klebsiella quasipneumoniae subsp. similipneumoniae]
MNHIEFIEKNVREELMRQGFTQAVAQGGFTQAVAQGGAYQAVDMYKRMSQASRKGRIFDDVLRHAKLWAEKQTLPSDKFEKKRAKPVKQQGLF